MRGELLSGSSGMVIRSGSSPRAWGTLLQNATAAGHRRIIPTCVGNSSLLSLPPIQITDHPHVRGELDRRQVGQCPKVGSSPRAWGTRSLATPTRHDRRLIPTCVGNSDTRVRHVPGGVAHPHVRGELVQNHLEDFLRYGSSPRAWGTHQGI